MKITTFIEKLEAYVKIPYVYRLREMENHRGDYCSNALYKLKGIAREAFSGFRMIRNWKPIIFVAKFSFRKGLPSEMRFPSLSKDLMS